MNGRELTMKALKKTGGLSGRRFAKLVGVSHTAVQHWLDGTNTPSFEQAATLAALAGLPPISTAAKLRLGSPGDEAEKKHGALGVGVAHQKQQRTQR